MASFFLSLGVDSSIGMTKDEYYFLYKDTEFKYIPAIKKGETDNFCGKFKKEDEDEAYKLMSEFLSALAFFNDAEIIPHAGQIGRLLNCSIKKYKRFSPNKKSVPINTSLEEFLITYIDCPDKRTLASLYRQARSANNVYLKVLLYWHILVYPSKREEGGAEYIDNNLENLTNSLDSLKRKVNLLKKNPVFLPKGGIENGLGKYIQKGIRHSIAHIVRRGDHDAKSLELDLLSEERHLNAVADILRLISRHKLEVDYELKKLCPPEVFRSITPD